VVACLKKMGRKRMAQRVAAAGLRNACGTHRLLEDALDHGLVQVMSAALSGRQVLVIPRRWKNPLPPPLSAGIGILEIQGPWYFHPPRTIRNVALVLPRHLRQLLRHPSPQPLRQPCDTIAIPRPTPHATF